MKQETFKFYKLSLTTVLAAIVSISIVHGVWYLPAIAILTAAALLFALKQRVRDITEDERDRKIGGKAALMAITLHSVAAAVVGGTLVAFDKDNQLLFWSGSAILYSTCAFVLLYALLFKWYARKQDQD